ncbi:MAG: hypothetical protein LQ337_008496 [Flavoplaca oasis]|nr:MAG: hypothetical protein LQ337_008496 [Flavoplaca oasis]
MSSNRQRFSVHGLDLPNEMLGAIFSFLPVWVLLSVSLVCKRFCTVAQPILFRRINLRIIPRAISSFSSVVSALSENPTLRGDVESLSLDVWTHSFSEKFEDQNSLISLLPRLQSPQLQPPPPELDWSRDPLIETLDLDSSGFGHFPEEIKGQERRRSSLEFLSELLWHHSLRNLKASGLDIRESDGARFFPKKRFRKSPIESVSLKICDGESVGALPQLLKSFKALQSFTLETWIRAEGEHTIVHGMGP